MTLAEAKKVFEIIKTSQAKMDMVEPILNMVDDSPKVVEVVEEQKPTKNDSPEPIKEKRVYKFKTKQCGICGSEFIPRYGAQKICDVCKDIQDTAKDIVSEIED